MRTCEDVREAVSSWLDGELDQELEAETLAHTSECEECRSFLEICRVMSDDLRADMPPVPETLIPGVMHRLSEEKQTAVPEPGEGRTNDRRKLYRRVAVWACAAACLALVIFAGPWNWRAGSAGPKADMYAADTAASTAAEPAEAPAGMEAEDTKTEGWSSAEAKSAAADGGIYDEEEAVTEESAVNEPVSAPAEEAEDDFVPRADGAGQFLGDYAAVITVYGGIPENVMILSEAEELLPDGVAWLIPVQKADDLRKALEDVESYEWLPGNEETSSWLLVCAGGN